MRFRERGRERERIIRNYLGAEGEEGFNQGSFIAARSLPADLHSEMSTTIEKKCTLGTVSRDCIAVNVRAASSDNC